MDGSQHDVRLVIFRFDADNVDALNRSVTSALDRVTTPGPGRKDVPEVDAAIGVQDLEAGRFHLLLVHRIDYRPDHISGIGDLVVFSEPRFAPPRADSLQLATPAYYRRQENLRPGIGDDRDGKLTKDAAPWLARRLGGSARDVHASIGFVSDSEPWVYCAAHYRGTRDLQRLRARFAGYDYTATTAIVDADDFAIRLGIDFALSFDNAKHASLSVLEAAVLEQARYSTSLKQDGTIDTFIHVYHGPVHYADQSGVIESQDDFAAPVGGSKAWFAKKTDLEWQSEYRFAVGTIDRPVEPRLRIPVSPELRELTRAL